MWISSSGGYIHLVQREQGRVHPLWIFACKRIFTRLKEISRTAGRLGTGCRHGLLPNQYKNSFVSFFPALLLSIVHFNFCFYFWLSFSSIPYSLNNISKSLRRVNFLISKALGIINSTPLLNYFEAT